MDSYIPDSGMSPLRAKKVMGFKYGLMDQNMKDFGRTIWQRDLVDSFLPMEMFIKEIGLMIRLMEMESIFMQKEQHIKVAGLKINKKG
jgi:hypothetical protein